MICLNESKQFKNKMTMIIKILYFYWKSKLILLIKNSSFLLLKYFFNYFIKKVKIFINIKYISFEGKD